MFSGFRAYGFLQHVQLCQIGALHCVQTAPPLLSVFHLLIYHQNLYIYHLICTRMANVYTHIPVRHIVTVGSGAQKERNKASVCSYTNTLMSGSVGAETNSCFIMFTCGAPTFDHHRCTRIAGADDTAMTRSCIFVLEFVSDCMCV